MLLGSPEEVLPNECLLLVIEYLAHDSATLRSLLTVNRLFLEASLPLLINKWLSELIDFGDYYVQESMALFQALIIKSIVHYPKDDFKSVTCTTSKISNELTLNLSALLMIDGSTSDYKDSLKPFVDYSKYITRTLSHFFPKVPVLKDMPLAIDPDIVTDDQYGHPLLKDPTIFTKLSMVWVPLNWILIRRNPERFTFLQTDIADAHQLLPVADRLANLDHLLIYRSEFVPQQELECLVSLLQKHRAAFPHQRPPNVSGMGDWTRIQFSLPENIDTAWCNRVIRFQQSAIKIYEALGQPRYIDANEFPEFYTRCQHIDMSQLDIFYDKFKARSPNEGPLREAMLKSAVRLKSLSLWVTSDVLFSRLHSPESPDVLPNLQILSLSTDDNPLMCRVLDDAMRECGRTLRSIYVHGGYRNELPRLIDTYTLGGWNLPCISTLDITLNGTGMLICLGAFNQCPFLTTIRIQTVSGGFGSITTRAKAFGDGFMLQRAPVWHLPRLKKLALSGLPALLFDHQSLGTMCNLETLELTSDKDDGILCYLPHLSWRLVAPSLLSSHSDALLEQRRLRYIQEERSIDTWHLPRLQTIHLEGACTLMFSFIWLQRCPSLHSLQMNRGWSTHQQRLPLSWTLHTPRLAAVTAATPVSTFGSTNPDLEMQPLYDSRLKSIILKEAWAMSKDDLLRLLTDYAPNLESLYVGSLMADQNTDGFVVLQTIQQADAVLKARGRESRLKSFGTRSVPSEPMRTGLNLVSVDQKWKEHDLIKVGRRIYRFPGRSAVSRNDFFDLKRMLSKVKR